MSQIRLSGRLLQFLSCLFIIMATWLEAWLQISRRHSKRPDCCPSHSFSHAMQILFVSHNGHDDLTCDSSSGMSSTPWGDQKGRCTLHWFSPFPPGDSLFTWCTWRCGMPSNFLNAWNTLKEHTDATNSTFRHSLVRRTLLFAFRQCAVSSGVVDTCKDRPYPHLLWLWCTQGKTWNCW